MGGAAVGRRRRMVHCMDGAWGAPWHVRAHLERAAASHCWAGLRVSLPSVRSSRPSARLSEYTGGEGAPERTHGW
eukprot:2526724-Prymnesium_polylepis.1